MKVTLSGQKMIIVGGSCELGLTLCKLSIMNNLYPILTYRSEEGREIINSELNKYRQKFETVFFDLGDYNSIEPLTRVIQDGCDYMVDFAHSDYDELIASGDDQAMSTYFERNITGRALLLKHVVRIMLAKRSGRLVYVSTTAAGCPNPGQGLYAASKLAGEALYKNVGIEMGQKGITTVCLRPGYVETGRGKKYFDNESIDLDRIPIRRLITKQEVVDAILFLLSDSSLAINATEIVLDGGLTATK